MLLFAVETTDQMQKCKICARNVKLFQSPDKANRYAVRTALSNMDGRVREDANIMFDVPLDGITKVYDKTDGNNETAPALAFITQCETEG